MATSFFIPAWLIRSSAPIHNCISGCKGFFTITGTSTPFNASAISCTEKGFTVVRAPIHKISTPCFSASSTCWALATSTVVSKPNSFFTFFSQVKPTLPTPSNELGLVLGFHIPERKIVTRSSFASSRAVLITCSSVSAPQGPLITSGRFAFGSQSLSGTMSRFSIFISILFLFPVMFHQFIRPRRLTHFFLRQKSFHHGLNIQHRGSVYRIQSRNKKSAAFAPDQFYKS